MQFEKEVTVMFDEVNYYLKGYINEFSQFGTHSFQSANKINFYFEKIEMINSTGILNWINWLNLVLQYNPRLQLTYSGCPKVVVDQMNKIKGFLPDSAIVKSFDVPFYCKDCGKNYSKQIVLGKEYRAGEDTHGQIDLEVMSCPKCNQPMEYDFVSDKYFKFLNPLLKPKVKKKIQD